MSRSRIITIVGSIVAAIILVAVPSSGSVGSLRDCDYFRLREGAWTGQTTATILSSGQTIQGTDDCHATFVGDGVLFQIEGDSDATGRMRKYRWVYSRGDSPNVFRYSYADSLGDSDTGTAVYDPTKVALIVDMVDQQSGVRRLTVSRFVGSDIFEVRYTIIGNDGVVRLEASAGYKRSAGIEEKTAQPGATDNPDDAR